MVAACIKFLFLVQSALAKCNGVTKDCQMPSSLDLLLMVQHHSREVTISKKQAFKMNDDVHEQCDWECYLTAYPDLSSPSVCGADTACAEKHYRQWGQREGRDCTCQEEQQALKSDEDVHDQCDWKCYLATYPDLSRACGTGTACAEKHYLQFGQSEGRDCTCPEDSNIKSTVSSKGLFKRILDAYHGQSGLLISVILNVRMPKNINLNERILVDTTQPILSFQDISATALRDDVPWFVYRPPRDYGDARGVIFDPASPPAVACAYPGDAGTTHRAPDRCGMRFGNMATGRCSMAPEYYLNFDEDFKRYHTCHYDKVEEALAAQRVYYRNRTHPGSITKFNEIVLKDTEAFSSSLAAYFWGHEGPFRTPTKHDVSACALKMEYDCSDLTASNKVSVFEFAELWDMEVFTGDMCKLDDDGFSSCSSDKLIREIDPATICAIDCPRSYSSVVVPVT